MFKLVIRDTTTNQSREVLSTLDPFQYIGYHPLKSTEGIDYVDTWRCFEDTSHFMEYCPSPRAKSEIENTEESPLLQEP